jgi:hypothetical protein
MVIRSRNPPKRLRGGSRPPLSAAGISGLQAGEEVNQASSNPRPSMEDFDAFCKERA